MGNDEIYKPKFLWLHAQNNGAVGIYLRLRYFDTHLQTRWFPGSAIFYQKKFHRKFSVYTGILWNICRHEGRKIPHLMLTKWFSLCRAKCRRCAHERRLWLSVFVGNTSFVSHVTDLYSTKREFSHFSDVPNFQHRSRSLSICWYKARWIAALLKTCQQHGAQVYILLHDTWEHFLDITAFLFGSY